MNISAVYAHEYTDSYSWYLQYGEPNTAPRSVDMSQFGEKHNLIWLDKSGSGNVYLTFDVGYDDGNVEPILDALKKHGAKGAFFVLPNFIKSCPELIERMNSEGHLICNHTTHHKDMSKVTSKEAFAAELADIENLYREQTGHEMAKFFRPPEGKFVRTRLNLRMSWVTKPYSGRLPMQTGTKTNSPILKKLLKSFSHVSTTEV